MPLLGLDPNVQGLDPTRDAAIIEQHMVTRPDLVRVDAEGKPSEIATLIVGGKIFEDWETVWIQTGWASEYSNFRFTCAEREPYPLPGAVLQFAPGNSVEIYLGGIQVISGVIITRQVAYDATRSCRPACASRARSRSGVGRLGVDRSFPGRFPKPRRSGKSAAHRNGGRDGLA